MEHLLNYCATHPESTIQYTASNMVLYIHTNALLFAVPGAKRRAGSHFYLSAALEDPNNLPSGPIPINGPIHTFYGNTIMNVEFIPNKYD
eukprot:2964917-Ditylum_brightwellii.AAC.1